MHNWVRVTLLAAVAVGLLAVGTADSLAQKEYKVQGLVGQPAPMLSGELLNGKTGSLDDFKGKVVLVDFWAVWCPPCVASFPHLRELHDKYSDQGLVIVGATRYFKNFQFANGKLARTATALDATAERDMLKDFTAHHKLKHTILTVGQDGTSNYKLEAWPTAVLIDRKGTVRMAKVGFSPAGMQQMEAQIKTLLAEKK